jgi:hypothetical protein
MNTVENVSSELRWVGAVLGAAHQPQVAARYIHMRSTSLFANPQLLETEYCLLSFFVFASSSPFNTITH